MKSRFFLIILMLTGCSSIDNAGHSNACAESGLYFVDYKLSQALYDYQITVNFQPEGMSLVTFSDGKRVVSTYAVSNIANKLKAISWKNVPLAISGNIRPITDLGVLTVTVYCHEGVYQIKRDLRIKSKNDGDFQHVKRIFNVLLDKLEKMHIEKKMSGSLAR